MELAGIQTLFLSAPDSICYVDGFRSEWLETNFYLPELAGLTMKINTLVFSDDVAEVLYGIPPDLVVVGT